MLNAYAGSRLLFSEGYYVLYYVRLLRALLMSYVYLDIKYMHLLYECKTSCLLYLKLTQADLSEVAAAFFSDLTPPPPTPLSDTQPPSEDADAQESKEEAEESTVSEVRKKRGLEEQTETEREDVCGGGGLRRREPTPPRA